MAPTSHCQKVRVIVRLDDALLYCGTVSVASKTPYHSTPWMPPCRVSPSTDCPAVCFVHDRFLHCCVSGLPFFRVVCSSGNYTVDMRVCNGDCDSGCKDGQPCPHAKVYDTKRATFYIIPTHYEDPNTKRCAFDEVPIKLANLPGSYTRRPPERSFSSHVRARTRSLSLFLSFSISLCVCCVS